MISRQNALNLAYWLYKVQPEVFAQLAQPARQVTLAQKNKFAALADDGLTTTFDPSADVTSSFDTGSFDPGLSSGDILSQLSPDLTSLPAPQLDTIGVDYSGSTVPSFAVDSSSDGGLFSAIGQGLSSVANFLTSAPGLAAVTGLATTIYKANSPQAASTAAQVARVQSGSTPAPITYGVNPSGQLVPVLKPAQTAGYALTPQALEQLVPASFRPYLWPFAIGAGLLWLLSRFKHRR